jgi:hypothetical protein
VVLQPKDGETFSIILNSLHRMFLKHPMLHQPSITHLFATNRHGQVVYLADFSLPICCREGTGVSNLYLLAPILKGSNFALNVRKNQFFFKKNIFL